MPANIVYPGAVRPLANALLHLLNRFARSAKQYLNLAVGQVKRITRYPKANRCLLYMGSKPDTLNLTLHTA